MDEGRQFHNEDIDELQMAMLNEVHAPVLLKYREKLVSDVLEQADNQERHIADKKERAAEDAFYCMLYETEIRRIKYMVEKYLQARLRKINNNLFWYWANHSEGMLSREEQAFVESEVDSHRILVEETFEGSVLCAERVLELMARKDTGGDTKQVVFVKTEKGFEEADVIVDGEEIKLGECETLLAKYGDVHDVVSGGEFVSLI
ncbi:MAG: GINS complex subunit Sld5 [Amphiamblys sp. WSBS2006]|nr:MAG: GINS complex subunit Sld5 [Amphiamblys sp. WSBS2006]